MRNLRKLTAVVMAIALVLTTMTSAFAASESTTTKFDYEAQAQVLKDLEILKGSDAGLMLEKELTRVEGATLVLKTVFKKTEDDMKKADLTVLDKFADAAKVADWAKGWMALAVKEGVISGTSDNKLDAEGKLLGKAFASMFMNGLGYKAENDYGTAVEKLSAKSGTSKLIASIAAELNDKILTRDVASAVLYDALTATAKDAKETVIVGYCGTDAKRLEIAKKAANLIPVPTALGVESVSATNLKEIYVTYNKAVDKDSAETVSNYSLSAGTVTGAALSGNTVTLTIETSAKQQDSLDVTVKNVKDTDGKVITETKKTVKMFDSTPPAVKSIEVTGPKQLKVTFTEPITSSGITTTTNFNIDDNKYSVSSVLFDSNNVLLVNLGTTLPAGEHKLTVNASGIDTSSAPYAIKDYAGFAVAKEASAFTYAEDKTVPTATISSAKQNEVIVKFSKPIDVNTRAYLSVYHTYNKTGAYSLNLVKWEDTQTAKYTVSGTNYLPIGSATIYVNGKSTDTNLVKDNWGNVLADTSFTVTITADTVKPGISKIEVVDSTHIDVTYTEAVNDVSNTNGNSATNVANYSIKDSSGTLVGITGITKQSNSNTYRIATTELNGGSYTISIKAVKDTSVGTNEMDAYTTTLNINDLVKPTVKETGAFSTGKNKIVISFSEAMATTGTYSVLEKANYIVNGIALTDTNTFKDATITLNAGGKAVTINLSTSYSALTSNVTKVNVARVADLAGNLTAKFSTDVTLTGDDIVAANIDLDSVKAIAKNKVEFAINQTLDAIDTSKFRVNFADGTSTPALAAIYANDSNKAIVTITVTDNAIKADLTSLSSIEAITGGAFTTTLGTKNSAGFTFASVDDYIAPTMDTNTISTNDADGNGKIDTVTVNFDENLYPASVQESDFTVSGYEIKSIVASGKLVTIGLKEHDYYDTYAKPDVTLVGSVSDSSAQHNTLGAQSAVAAKDGAKAVVVSAVQSFNGTTTTVAITFSEAVSTSTSAIMQAVTTTDAAFLGATATGVSHTASSNVITYTVTGVATTLTGITTTLYDEAGNVVSIPSAGVTVK